MENNISKIIMPITPQNVVRHELIGLPVKIVRSTDPTLKGVKGKVVDETYGTLRIETKEGKEKTVAKKDCVFVFTLPDRTKVEVEGWVIVGRPEDRIKKKLPRW
jgi:ribonuclease P protein subunit POP4